MSRPAPLRPAIAGSLRRRRLLQWPLTGLLAPAAVPAQDDAPQAAVGGQRLALLIGNRQYPTPYDLPSIGKNVRDLEQALQARGFAVEAHVDTPLASAHERVEAFARRLAQAGDDAVAFFYFSGHGVQVDAENLLVSATVNPTGTPDTLRKGSLLLMPDVIARLPRPPRGQLIAVVDACRTSLKPMAPGEGMNQVEAPPGCLIAFSTAAGKPALAPAVETLNTFFTGALVKQIAEASDEISFSDVMRLAKIDTQRTMENHAVALIRRFAQHPFIAENIQRPVLLARPAAPAPAAPGSAAQAKPATRRFSGEDEARDWAALQATRWPPDVLRLAEAFMRNHPGSKLAGAALVVREGAAEAAALLARGDIRLFRRSFNAPDADDPAYRLELLKAARGDKDAAARIGRHWFTRATSGPTVSRYEGWMQYAAELGNGIASYELALHYRRLDQPQAAARWDAHSRDLGYTPPPSLDNRRK